MKKLLASVFSVVVLLLLIVSTGVQAQQQEPQLNLSHIECKEDGRLEIHFVLVHTEETPVPGTLTFTDNGTEYSVGRDKFTGETWHFSYYAQNGYHEITAASVEWNGQIYQLHNPKEYTGEYNCGDSPASASVTLGSCSWTEKDGSLTDVVITLVGASLTINGSTYDASTTIKLAPGTYPYTWVALPGYTGSGDGSVTVGSCPPNQASATITIGACKWVGESETTVEFVLDHAILTLNGQEYTQSGSVKLTKGDYPYSWVAESGYQGSGEGTIHLGSCKPNEPPEPPIVEAPVTGGNGPSLWVILWSWLTSLFGG